MEATSSNSLAFWLLIGGIVLLVAGFGLLALMDWPQRSYEWVWQVFRRKRPRGIGD
jgi:hypothetical protein